MKLTGDYNLPQKKHLIKVSHVMEWDLKGFHFYYNFLLLSRSFRVGLIFFMRDCKFICKSEICFLFLIPVFFVGDSPALL